MRRDGGFDLKRQKVSRKMPKSGKFHNQLGLSYCIEDQSNFAPSISEKMMHQAARIKSSS